MAWIPGTHEETFEVDAEYEAVRDFFCDPAEFHAAFTELERAEEIEDGVWRWVLNERTEKGLKFQPDYTVSYTRRDNVLTWETVDGNLRTQGRCEVRDTSPRPTVDYSETIETELPIPKITVRVFQPIVAREVKKGIVDYLQVSRKILEGRG